MRSDDLRPQVTFWPMLLKAPLTRQFVGMLEEQVHINFTAPPDEQGRLCVFLWTGSEADVQLEQLYLLVSASMRTWMSIVQDALNAMLRSVFPFGNAINETGTFDCATASLATVARHWYRRDLPVPLPANLTLEAPEFLLLVNQSPALRELLISNLHGRGILQTSAQWFMPLPQYQYTPPRVPQCLGAQQFASLASAPTPKGFAESTAPVEWPPEEEPYGERTTEPEATPKPSSKPVQKSQVESATPSILALVASVALIGGVGYVLWKATR